jgi:integrase
VSSPYRKQKKVGHRPWFTPDEYKKLYKATNDYKRRPLRDKERWAIEQLHDQILFLANTGLRPDEAKNIEHRDVKMVKDAATGELILEIEVRGKVGYGPCKSRPEAVKVYQRLRNRAPWEPQGRKPRSKKAIAAAAKLPEPKPYQPLPSDKLFPGNHIKLFNKILTDEDVNLKLDRDGKPHTLYSLRHFYICERLTEGADVYQLAKNCRTSVEMIQKHYAVHIMGAINTAAVNTRNTRRPRTDPRAN